MPSVCNLRQTGRRSFFNEDSDQAQIHSFFMMRLSQAQSFRSCHSSFVTAQCAAAIPSVRASSHAERGKLRQRIHSFFMMRLSQAQNCRSCHLRHACRLRSSDFQSCAHTMWFLTGFAQRAASHAERGNLRQRIHSFFMMRLSQAQSFQKLPPPAQCAAAISSRARMLVVSHRFCAARCVACRAWQLAPAHTQLLHDEVKPSAKL